MPSIMQAGVCFTRGATPDALGTGSRPITDCEPRPDGARSTSAKAAGAGADGPRSAGPSAERAVFVLRRCSRPTRRGRGTHPDLKPHRPSRGAPLGDRGYANRGFPIAT